MKCGVQNILHVEFVGNMDAHILSVFVWKENPINMKLVTEIVRHQCKFRVHDANLNA